MILGACGAAGMISYSNHARAWGSREVDSVLSAGGVVHVAVTSSDIFFVFIFTGLVIFTEQVIAEQLHRAADGRAKAYCHSDGRKRRGCYVRTGAVATAVARHRLAM
jgi:hypothetical protein